MEIIPAKNLKLGMFVAEPDCPWMELPFLLQGFVVSEMDELEVFRKHCKFVQIDRSRSLEAHYRAPDVVAETHTGKPQEKTPVIEMEEIRKPHPDLLHIASIPRNERRRRFLDFLCGVEGDDADGELAGELTHIEPRFDALTKDLKRTFEHMRAERSFDLENVREGVGEVAESLQRNPDAVMWLLRLKNVDQYSFDHAMDVSVNLLLFGTHIGFRGQRLLDLGVAGMLQDVGKTQLSSEVLAKTGDLTPEEQHQVRSHVASSLEILMLQQSLSREILYVVARHHERWDGSGYPHGLAMDQIGVAAEMAGLVDSFCAMLRNKPYRSAVGHQQALEELFHLRGTKFNPVLMEQFVQCVGLYPIGTLVEMASGEVGVVIQQNRVQRSRPKLLLMLDADKALIHGYKILDLRSPSAAKQRIARALPHDAYGLAAYDYYLD